MSITRPLRIASSLITRMSRSLSAEWISATKGGDELYLVGLQVPDHVPFDVLGQRFVFCSQLLRPALAEDALSCGVSLFDEGRGVRFGYGHQRDAFGQCLPHVR